MPENTLKCPFRQDDNGEFKECYREKCIAFFDARTYCLHPEDKKEQPACRKLFIQNNFYGCI